MMIEIVVIDGHYGFTIAVISFHNLPLLPFTIEQIKYGIEGLVNSLINHDDEIVLTRVKIFTLEILIEDIQITMALLPPGFLEPLMAPKRKSTSAAPAMTQAAIRNNDFYIIRWSSNLLFS
ncbi:hypothetical protein Tco_0691454 [Tanacetum coccineum]